ncbi:MAG: T9SS type A sorting domain-containing protein [Bacteroidota bacterium]|jgi:hypothetical protein
MKNIIRFIFLVFCLYLNSNPLHAQWVQTNSSSYPDPDIHSFAVLGANLFVGTYDGIFLSTNNGTSWTVVDSGLTNIDVYVLVANGTNLLAGGFGVFLSTNNGTSWTAVSRGLPTYAAVVALAISGSNLIAGDVFGNFLLTNNDTSWTAVKVGLTNNIVNAFAVSGTNLFAGGSGVFLSTDNGISWTAAGLTKNSVRAFAVNGTNLFAGTDGGVFLSSNNGTSWTAVSSGLTNTDVCALAVNGTNLFAGTFFGDVFLSTNNGTSWTAVSSGLPANVRIYTLCVNGSNLFAGTTGSGIWKRPISEMVTGVEENHNQFPNCFALLQNYPNPFNPSTNISFNLLSKSFVSLKVFDIIGREVATIVSGEMLAGSYSRQWNAASMSSGIYFYRLQAGSFIETKKLLLLK